MKTEQFSMKKGENESLTRSNKKFYIGLIGRALFVCYSPSKHLLFIVRSIYNNFGKLPCTGKKIFLFNRPTIEYWDWWGDDKLYPRLEERSSRFRSLIRFKIWYWIGGEVLNRIFFLLPSFNNVGNGKEVKNPYACTLVREKIIVRKREEVRMSEWQKW